MTYLEPSFDYNLERFCESLCCGQSPMWIPVRSPSYARTGHCYENVEKRIKQKGGRKIYGWEISNFSGIWLEAQFHCVWENKKGGLIDVTPEHFGRLRVLFLKDTRRVYSGEPIAVERFPFDGFDDTKLRKVWDVHKEIEHQNDFLRNQGIDPQGQLGASLVQPRILEYKTLIDELKGT